MRKTTLLLFILALISGTNVFGQIAGTPYTIAAPGGINFEIPGSLASVTAGSARIQPATGAVPAGMALFALRQNGILIGEATVPAAERMLIGRIFAQLSAPARTGIAIANPNGQAATIRFYFTDSAGMNSSSGTFTLAPNSQIARFLDEAPFSGTTGLTGSFTFDSNIPVAVMALRGLTNERGDFLTTTLPVANLAGPTSPQTLLPHYAVGGGWSTKVVLLNPTDTTLNGALVVFPESSTGSSENVPFAVPQRSSRIIDLADRSGTLHVGWIRIDFVSGIAGPIAAGIISFRHGDITVSEAAVSAVRSSADTCLFAEALGLLAHSEMGSLRTGAAIINPGASPASVNFELLTLEGSSAGLRGSTTLTPYGHMSLFVDQIPGMQAMRVPFKGLLLIKTTSAEGIAVTGFRCRYNERRDFLITTMPAADQKTFSTVNDVFPHIVFGNGYMTTLLLLNPGSAGNQSGLLNGFTSAGQPLALPGVQGSSSMNLGPWNNDLEYYESNDGLRFSKTGLFSERGGVPTIACAPDGRVFAMFQWFPVDRQESFDQIAVTISSDEGRTWSVPQTIVISGMPDTLNRSFDPTLVVLPDGRFRLYFSSERGTPQGRRGNRAIFSAVSTDGIHFMFEPGQRFGLENAETYDTAVALLGDTWHLYCPLSSQMSGYHATSSDGLFFVRQPDVTIAGTQRQWLGNVVAFSGGLRFYGTGPGGWVARSTDGFNWTLETSQNSPSPDPGVAITRSGRTIGIALGPRRPDILVQTPFPN